MKIGIVAMRVFVCLFVITSVAILQKTIGIPARGRFMIYITCFEIVDKIPRCLTKLVFLKNIQKCQGVVGDHPRRIRAHI